MIENIQLFNQKIDYPLHTIPIELEKEKSPDIQLFCLPSEHAWP